MEQSFQPVLTPGDMKKTEQKAFERGMNATLLMEHAALRVVDALQEALGGQCENRRVLFLCGTGNNGGDGLAAARLFAGRGGQAAVLLSGRPHTEEGKLQYTLAQNRGIQFFDAAEAEAAFGQPFDGYVDALLGIGLSGAPDANTERLIALLLERSALDGRPVIAVDVPSGMNAMTGKIESAAGICVRARETVTFHALKPGLLFTPHREYAGRITVKDIGLDAWAERGVLALQNKEIDARWARPGFIRSLPKRPLSAHKGDCGRVLIYAGSLGMAGAAAVCGKAAVTAGAGLTTFVCDQAILPILQTLVPAAMALETQKALEDLPAWDVLALGCGLGQSEEKWRNIQTLWDPNKPSVWDADALNMLSAHPVYLGEKAFITPHPGEAARLLGWPLSRVMEDRLAAAEGLCRKYGCTVLLKSDVSIACKIAADAPRFILISAGTPALAKGGSGDALCGILAALANDTQRDSLEIAALAALWHGLAAAAGEMRFGRRELTADQLIGCLHAAERL